MFFWNSTTLLYSPNLEPVSFSMSSFNCCFLTCIQISREAGQVVWNSHLLKNFPQFVVIQTVKVFGIVNKAEIATDALCCILHLPHKFFSSNETEISVWFFIIISESLEKSSFFFHILYSWFHWIAFLSLLSNLLLFFISAI